MLKMLQERGSHFSVVAGAGKLGHLVLFLFASVVTVQKYLNVAKSR